MDLVILKHGQVTRATPELAPSPNYHTSPTEDVSALYRFNVYHLLHGRFLWHWARTRDMPTVIRYLDHLATPATGPSSKALE
ncbi:hypothetical protein TNCV_3829811 [Trichonephila clavipes]|nr:hypothetical protein TNCV_3829811 [Trichonephila clavipes]